MKVQGTKVYRGEAEMMLEQTIRLGGERGTLNLVLSFDLFPRRKACFALSFT